MGFSCASAYIMSTSRKLLKLQHLKFFVKNHIPRIKSIVYTCKWLKNYIPRIKSIVYTCKWLEITYIPSASLNYIMYRQTSSISAPTSKTLMFIALSSICLCPIHWRCSWSSAGRQSEWSRSLLPTKVPIVLEVWKYKIHFRTSEGTSRWVSAKIRNFRALAVQLRLSSAKPSKCEKCCPRFFLGPILQGLKRPIPSNKPFKRDPAHGLKRPIPSNKPFKRDPAHTCTLNIL